MGVKLKCKLLKKEMLIDGIYKFSVEAPEIANIARAGQFLEIKVSETGEPFLRRPISIFNLDKENGVVEFIFQVKGKGTELLKLKEIKGCKSRCILENHDKITGKCVVCGKEAKETVVWGIQY